MRKTVAWLLLAVTILSVLAFSACEEEPSAYERLRGAVDKTADLGEVNFTMDIGIHMQIPELGVTADTPLQQTVQAKNINLPDETLYASKTIEMMGSKMSEEYYIRDGYGYFSINGTNGKMKKEDMGDEETSAVTFVDHGFLHALDEEILAGDGVKLETLEDGGLKITAPLTRAQFDGLYAEVTEDLLAQLGEKMTDLAVSNCMAEITLTPDGYVGVYHLHFDISCQAVIVEDPTSVNIEMDVTVTYKDPGKTVTVNSIFGYKSFPYYGNDSDLGDL